MSTRPQINPISVLTAANMAGSLISLPTIIQKCSMASYAIKWSGSTPVGTVSVQVSNDYSLYADGKVNNPGTWNTMTVSYQGAPVQTIPVTGNTGNGFIDIDQSAGYALRLIYTRISGTGTMDVIFTAKVS